MKISVRIYMLHQKDGVNATARAMYLVVKYFLIVVGMSDASQGTNSQQHIVR